LNFAAKVHQRPRGPAPALGGKGSPAALVVCALVSALLLGGAAAALGGGLIYVPAAIPLVTVAAVLGARSVSAGRDRQVVQQAAAAGHDGRRAMPADVREQVESQLWPG
jgi:hypothetical protein